MANIMIVDDSNFMRMTLRKVIEKLGHQVAGEATTGREAVELFELLRPDLVFMDITMPDLNGIDAVKAIREKYPHAKIVMCSAMGQQKLVVDAIEAGAKDFIVKPFEESRIIETIHRLLEQG
jgi:Response regulator receiver domain.